MNAAARKILKDALKLPLEFRAALAGSLLESLHGEPDAGVEAAWSAEIKKRLHELDSGKVKPVPWSEARRRIVGSRGARS